MLIMVEEEEMATIISTTSTTLGASWAGYMDDSRPMYQVMLTGKFCGAYGRAGNASCPCCGVALWCLWEGRDCLPPLLWCGTVVPMGGQGMPPAPVVVWHCGACGRAGNAS